MKERHYSHGGAPRGPSTSGDCTRRRLLGLLLASGLGAAAASTPCGAATLLRGQVVHITDAVTFTLRTAAGGRLRVILAGVAPPAAGSSTAAAARRALADLIFDRLVDVHAADAQAVPLRGRVLQRGVDVAMQMVAAGWLRAYRDDALLLSLERQARAARRGQWADSAD